MGKVNLKKYMSVNKIKQKDIVDVLGVSKAFVSIVAKGNAGLSDESIEKLRQVEEWDITPLFEVEQYTREEFEEWLANGRKQAEEERKFTEQVDELTKELNSLREQLKKLEDEKERYWKIIQNLMENGKSVQDNVRS